MNNKEVFKLGLKDGLPIGLGYFAVAFSLGIVASLAGLTAFQGFIASLTTEASAGEYVAFKIMEAKGSYIELILVTIITNARYLLMSTAISQRFREDMAFKHRLFMGHTITDELFAITIARPGKINPYYSYGAMSIACVLWALGTALGITMGNVLPANIVSALSVALYGMFLAAIIPPAKKDKIIAGVIVVSFIVSLLFDYLPFSISSGTKTIILTLLIAGGAALLFPVKEENYE